MRDPVLAAAFAEAYASAPVGQVVWETIEIWHPSFTLPIRVVRDRVALEARIEAGAARNAGEVVTFTPYQFALVPPDLNSGTIPQATLEIDNVDREIGRQLDAAVMVGTPTIVIWRSYLSGHQLVGPEYLPPIQMELKSVSSGVLRISATVGFRDLLNQAFPALDYDSDRFPGLIP